MAMRRNCGCRLIRYQCRSARCNYLCLVSNRRMLNSRVRKDGDCGRGYWDVRFAEGQCAAMELQESSVGSASVSDIEFIGQGLAFRFLVAVDAEGFSRCCAAEQAGIQDDLDRALGQAAEATGMDRN